ncbi:hypothetical protein BGX34_011107 [Mortierella sp. NVP85]|nr:hypothetical protein BGX34_011107 [Mortierella sp. NVP85]
MPPVRVVSQAQVASILSNIDREDILTGQAKAFHSYSANETQTPLRSSLHTDHHTALIMPARINTASSAVSAVKIVSIPMQDSKDGLPGVTVVMDNETGEPRGLVNARLLTAIRTAAASALATRAIVASSIPTNKPLTLVIFGSGAQARAHIQMLIHVLPQIHKVVICNRTFPRAQNLIQELQPQYSGNGHDNHNKSIVEMIAYSTSTGESTTSSMTCPSESPESLKGQLKQIVQSADVICTCTNTREPLFPGEWVKPGTHINMVGSFKPEMHEVDQTLIGRAFILADARHECEEEAGELILAKKLTGQSGILAELGGVFDKDGQLDHASLPSEFKSLATSTHRNEAQDAQHKDVSIFKSVGIAAQDVAITALVLEKAEAMNLGTVADF